MAAAQHVVTSLTIDARGAAAGAAQYTRAMQGAQAAASKVIDINQRLAAAAESGVTMMTRAAMSVSRATTEWNRVTAAVDPAVRVHRELERAARAADAQIRRGLVTEVEATRVLSAYRTQLEATATARTRAGGAALGGVTVMPGRQNQLLTDAIGDTARLSEHEVRNLAFQINDLGTMLAAGSSPFQAIVTQGGQISQILGPRGARGAIAAIGQGIASMLTPVNLFIVGFAAAAAGVSYFIRQFNSGMPTLEETLRAHETLVKEIAEAYDAAGEAAEDYGRRSRVVLRVETDSQLTDLRKQLQEAAEELFNPGFGRWAVLNPADSEIRQYPELQREILDLYSSIAAGHPEILQFQEDMARIADSTADETIDRLVHSALQAVRPLEDLQRRAEALARALGMMRDADLQPGRFNPFEGVPLHRRAEDASMSGYWENLGLDPSKVIENQIARKKELDDLRRAEIERLGQRQATYRDSWQTVNEHIEAMKLDAATMGMSAGAAARYRTEHELMNAALRSGIELTPQLRQEIAGLAQTEAAWADYNEQLQQSVNLMDDLRDATSGAFSEILKGIREGDIGGAVSGIADRLAGRLDDAIGDMFSNALLGERGTLGSGMFGSFVQDLLGRPVGEMSVTAGMVSVNGALAMPGLSNLPGFVGRAPVGAVTGRDLPYGGPAIGSYRAAQEIGLQGDVLSRARNAIAAIESMGSGDYGAVGPTHPRYGRALGRYQVMEANVGPWTRDALGYAMLPDDFLASRAAQDAVFDHRFGGYLNRTGSLQDAASMWFTGRPLAQGANAADVFGTTGSAYVDKFMARMDELPQTFDRVAQAASQVAPGVDQLTGGIGRLGQTIAGGGGAGGLLGLLFGRGGGAIYAGPPLAGAGLFAGGGIATRPSIFGEAGPEAAVPLPDGRSIPVRFEGGGSKTEITSITMLAPK